MKALLLAACAATLLAVLVGCGSPGGSDTSSASVESASASGAVASVEACPEGAPARGLLKGDLAAGDGAFGTVYNGTGSTLWLWSQKREDVTPCRLDAGKGAGYASQTDGSLRPEDAAVWQPADKWEWGVFWILVTSSPEVSSSGVALGVHDPYIGTPNAGSVYRAPDGSRCERDDVLLKTGRNTSGLEENSEYRLKGSSQGSVLVKRLGDSKEIAREWMPGETQSDDWARIDLYVESIGTC